MTAQVQHGIGHQFDQAGGGEPLLPLDPATGGPGAAAGSKRTQCCSEAPLPCVRQSGCCTNQQGFRPLEFGHRAAPAAPAPAQASWKKQSRMDSKRIASKSGFIALACLESNQSDRCKGVRCSFIVAREFDAVNRCLRPPWAGVIAVSNCSDQRC